MDFEVHYGDRVFTRAVVRPGTDAFGVNGDFRAGNNSAGTASGHARRAGELLSGCARAIEILASASRLADGLESALAIIGDVTHVDRVRLYRFRDKNRSAVPSVHLVAEHRRERRSNWNGDHNENQVWNESWYQEFLDDRLIRGDHPDQPSPSEANPAPSVPLLALPIECFNELWGFLRLDRFSGNGDWHEEVETTLRAFGRILAKLVELEAGISNPSPGTSVSLTQLASEAEITFQLDARGRWRFLSPAWDRLTGFAATRALGNHHSAFLFSLERGAGQDLRPLDLLADLDESGARSGEAYLKTDDGSEIWVSFALSRADDSDRGEKSYQGILIDIRDRKAQESKERETEQALQSKNAELLKALVAAQEATRLKSHFLATMSHEIRTPLNGVLGMTSLLLRTSLDRQQREFTEAIQTSADSLLSIVTSILDYSKLEAQRVEVEQVPYHPLQLVEEVLTSLSEPASRKRVDLVTDLRFPLPERVIGDPGKVKQVLLNLVGNAIKFSSKGEVSVSVTWQPLVEPCGELSFAVTDRGIGIAAETMRRLFRPFSQAEPGTARIYGGTGLGLAICRQLCDIMGGEIEVQSQPGVGSRFQVNLRTTAEGRVESGWNPANESERLDGKRVVLANFGNLAEQAWTNALSLAGVEISTAKGLQETNQRLSAESADHLTDIVVFDTQSLEGGGPEIVRRVRLATRNPNLLLVLLDSIHDAVDRSVLKGIEPLLLLRKPISPYRALGMIAPASHSIHHAPRKPVQRAVGLSHGDPGATMPVLVFASNFYRRKTLVYLLNRLGTGGESADSFHDVLERSAKNGYSAILLDPDLGLSTELEAAQKIRSTFGASAPPLVVISASGTQREQLRNSGLFDAVVDASFQRDDLRGILDQVSSRANPGLRASAS